MTTWPKDLPAMLHATSVAFSTRGVLIVGRSGGGKSSLALELMAFGAACVSDDLTELFESEGGLYMRRPTTKATPAIEARGFGLLAIETARDPAPLSLVVDLGRTTSDRLPERQAVMIGPYSVDMVHKPETGSFSSVLMQYLRAGFADEGLP